jgi:hypothetical protein
MGMDNLIAADVDRAAWDEMADDDVFDELGVFETPVFAPFV